MNKKPTKAQVEEQRQAGKNKGLSIGSILVHAICLEGHARRPNIPPHVRGELNRAAAMVRRAVEDMK